MMIKLANFGQLKTIHTNWWEGNNTEQHIQM